MNYQDLCRSMRDRGWLSHVIAAAKLRNRDITTPNLQTALTASKTFGLFEANQAPAKFARSDATPALLLYADKSGKNTVQHRDPVWIDKEAGLLMRVHDSGRELVGLLEDFPEDQIEYAESASAGREVPPPDADRQHGPMSEQSPRISPSVFAAAFHRLERAVADEDEPTERFNFQSGLAYDWEHYKEWVYYEAQRRLAWHTWKQGIIGSGKILEATIRAIEINSDANYKNNIVDWEARWGEEKTSHRKLTVALETPALRAPAESALYRMYVEGADPERCFEELTELFGGRYDLISYLFFIRDWQKFLPTRPNIFAKAFDELGVPHAMAGRCTWGNYVGFLDRLRDVQRLLSDYDIPGGVRFIDAHSFCWMLASDELVEPVDVLDASVTTITPRAGTWPARETGDGDVFSQDELDAKLAHQRRVGDLAQSIVLRAERARLEEEGRADLAKMVEDVSPNVLLGYDIASFLRDGSPKPIEVKAAGKRGKDLRFFISERERSTSQTLLNYTFALVTELESPIPRIFEFRGADLPGDSLRPTAYEALLAI